MVGDSGVEATTVILGGSVNDTSNSGAQTGSVATTTATSAYEISAANGIGINTYDSVGALHEVSNTASTALSAINNAAQASEASSTQLSQGVNTALQNRSQSSIQAAGSNITSWLMVAGAVVAIYFVFRAHK